MTLSAGIVSKCRTATCSRYLRRWYYNILISAVMYKHR